MTSLYDFVGISGLMDHLLMIPEGLGIRDVMNFRLCCKATRLSIKNLPRGFSRVRMVRRLDGAGISGDEFCDLLGGIGSVISGSFPLNVILGEGESWEPADVDVFFTIRCMECDHTAGFGGTDDDAQYNHKVDRTIESLVSLLSRDKFVPVTEEKKGEKDYTVGLGLGRECICLERTYEPSDENRTELVAVHFIGLIQPTRFVRDADVMIKTGRAKFLDPLPIDHFVKFFDLDFCRLKFDGEKIRADSNVWDSVLNKRSTNPRNARTERLGKYGERGFTVDTYFSLDDQPDAIKGLIISYCTFSTQLTLLRVSPGLLRTVKKDSIFLQKLTLCEKSLIAANYDFESYLNEIAENEWDDVLTVLSRVDSLLRPPVGLVRGSIEMHLEDMSNLDMPPVRVERLRDLCDSLSIRGRDEFYLAEDEKTVLFTHHGRNDCSQLLVPCIPLEKMDFSVEYEIEIGTEVEAPPPRFHLFVRRGREKKKRAQEEGTSEIVTKRSKTLYEKIRPIIDGDETLFE